MLRWVRKREDHRALVDSRQALDDLLRESPAYGADTDDRCRLDVFDRSEKIVRRCVLVCIRLLEVDEISAGCFQQAVDVEHVDPRLSLFKSQSFLNQSRAQEVSEAYAGGACAQE